MLCWRRRLHAAQPTPTNNPNHQNYLKGVKPRRFNNFPCPVKKNEAGEHCKIRVCGGVHGVVSNRRWGCWLAC